MPKVTLLQPEWNDRVQIFGRRQYHFVGGQATEVPAAIALVLKKLREGGKPVFKVEALPQVIKAVPAPVEAAKPQNVTRASSRQKRLEECLSLPA